MKLFPHVSNPVVLKPVAGAIAVITAFSVVWGAAAYADPAQDNVANFNELSRQAQQMLEKVQSAQADLDRKVQLLGEADRKHAAAVAALADARAQLAVHQGAVDKVAAAIYMGGRADGLNAILTAASPAAFIDKLAIQRVITTRMSDEIRSFRQVEQSAMATEAGLAESAASAKAAADAAAAVQADLRKKESDLVAQVAAVKLRYGLLSPAEQALLGPGAAIPTVGMGGLVPNARILAAYILATYPGVTSIGGVRSDPLPDHPSGHAIDIMIGSDMGLGDAINADVQSQSGRFGVKYTMWRVPSHFNHVHVTVN